MIDNTPAGALRKLRAVAVAGMLAMVLCGTRPSAADTAGTPLITIPPAKVTPPATARPPDDIGAPTIEAAPRTLLPTRVQILHDSQGAGIAMYGALNGKAASATAVVLAIFANSGAFDSIPATQIMLADGSDRHAQALFTAAVHGAAVDGIAVASLSDTGGDVTVFYDDAESFVVSFPRMQQAFAQSGGVGMAVLSPAEYNADAGWQPVIAAMAKGGSAPTDTQLAQSLVAKLSADTGRPWRIVRAMEYE